MTLEAEIGVMQPDVEKVRGQPAGTGGREKQARRLSYDPSRSVARLETEALRLRLLASGTVGE